MREIKFRAWDKGLSNDDNIPMMTESWKDFVAPFRTRTKTLDNKFIVESVPDENVLSKIREELAEEVVKSQESYFFKGFDTKALLRIKEVLDNELKSRKDF